MKKQLNSAIKAYLVRSTSFLLLLLAVGVIPFSLGQRAGKEPLTDDPDARAAWERLRLQDEHGQISPNALRNAYEQKKAMPFLLEAWAELMPKLQGTSLEEAEQLVWTSIGPGNIGGRIRSIVVHPNVPTTMWLGAVGGGVWKTTTAGTSWSTTTDYLANIAVSCMAIDPTNPNIVYAGTGESFAPYDGIQGDGIFKTTDGGITWRQLSSTANNPAFYWVNRLAVSPVNPQLLLAVTWVGILRSQDGGATWGPSVLTEMIADVLFQPNDGNRCIAGSRAYGNVYYSTDAGLNWAHATSIWPASAGRVELAYSKSNSSIVYANVEYNGGQLYRSTDGGHSFSGSIGSGPTGASWYNNVLWIDPTNSNTLVFGGGALYRSTDGGVTRTDITSLHGDNHVVVEDPGYGINNNRTAYCGNDGGIYKTSNILASPVVWTSLNHNLGITQFYGGAGNVTSGTIIGGTQDNGTLRYGAGAEGWNSMYPGDGGFCAADQTDPNYFYGEYVYLQIVRSTNGGGSASSIWNGPCGIPGDCGYGHPCANFIAPLLLDPSNSNTLLGGATELWRSTNAKDAQPCWASIKPAAGSNISAIAVAPDDSNIIWVGHNNGAIYYTTNGAALHPTWTQVNTGLPARYCERITIDPVHFGSSRYVYVTFGGFNADNVWRTLNNGLTWGNISSGLPSIPVHSLVISPSDHTRLYIGTHLGVFASADGGIHWSPSNEGPANTVVDELFWVGTNLVAATHGRSMFAATIQQ